jgi:DNA-binding MarR family transcriptional regulator
MIATGVSHPVEQISQELFEVITQIFLAVPRSRPRAGDLKEIEFLTLSILQEHGTMNVGDIQRLLGVLPAQMSRIIRSLEARESPLIACQINPRDKRKIDVCMTAAGEKALQGYQAVRVNRIAQILRDLPEEEQEELTRLLHVLLEKVHSMEQAGAK